jgi:hypothetical protein
VAGSCKNAMGVIGISFVGERQAQCLLTNLYRSRIVGNTVPATISVWTVFPTILIIHATEYRMQNPKIKVTFKPHKAIFIECPSVPRIQE